MWHLHSLWNLMQKLHNPDIVAPVVQLAEHVIGIDEVVGSNPTRSSTKCRCGRVGLGSGLQNRLYSAMNHAGSNPAIDSNLRAYRSWLISSR